MMMDIVKNLRSEYDRVQHEFYVDYIGLNLGVLKAAADEIERLRAIIDDQEMEIVRLRGNP